MRALHPVQLNILRKLLFTPQAKFKDLKNDEMENSHFVFYLDKLLNDGLIVENEFGYSLTTYGKEYANRMDDSSLEFKIQPKTTTVFCCVRDSGKDKKYLIYKRLKNPFYGQIGFPAHKVWWGERLSDAVLDGLRVETGLEGKSPMLIAIRHYQVYTPEEELLEDKIMYIYLIQNPQGELKESVEGEYYWVRESELENKFDESLPEFEEEYNLINNFKGEITFKEIDQYTNKF